MELRQRSKVEEADRRKVGRVHRNRLLLNLGVDVTESDLDNHRWRSLNI